MNDEQDDAGHESGPPADPVLNSPGPKTGYKQPPDEHRFRKGESGNPNGRPKGGEGRRNIAHRVLLEEHDVIEGGRSVRRTTLALILLTFRSLAFEGDTKACKDLQKLSAKYDPEEQVKPNAGVLIVPGRLTVADWEALFSPADSPMSEFGQDADDQSALGKRS